MSIQNLELRVLAAFFRNPESYPKYSDQLNDALFADAGHKQLYRAIQAVYEAEGLVDDLSAKAYLEKQDEQLFPITQVLELENEAGCVAALPLWIGQLQDQATRRKRDALKLRAMAHLKDGDIAGAMELLEGVVDTSQSDVVLQTHTDRLQAAQKGRDWRIEGLLEKGDIGALIALPGVGKTLVACEMATAIAGGYDFAGKAVQTGKVLYLCVDAPKSTSRRLSVVNEATGQNIVTISEMPSLPGAFPQLQRIIEQNQIACCFIDTWDAARAHSEGGYAGQDGLYELIMGGLRKIAIKTNCTFVIIHHATRADGGRAKGPVVFDAKCEMIANVKSEGPAKISLTVTKMRDGKEGPVGQWDIENHKGVPILKFAGEIKVSQKVGNEVSILKSLLAGKRTHREIEEATGINRGSVGRILQRLKEKGHIGEDNTPTMEGLEAAQ